jgi:uncharacterized protein YjbJ (UPF0337 family)
MSWKEDLKKLKEKVRKQKSNEKTQAEDLADELIGKIGESLEILKEFAQVSNAKIKLIDRRHKEIDSEIGKPYYAGNIIISVQGWKEKPSVFKSLFEFKKKKILIAQIKFPHPEAIENQEGYENAIAFSYSDIKKEITIENFTPEWLKENLEQAYYHFLNIPQL